MNPTYEIILQKALLSDNPQAILSVASLFNELNEPAFAKMLIQRIEYVGGLFGFGITVPPTPIPPGWRRATAKEITKPVLTFAQTALVHATPIGKQQIAVVTNPNKSKVKVLALTEHHLDNHPARLPTYKAGTGPVFLHPGVSMLVEKAPVKQITPYQTQSFGLPTSNNEFAGFGAGEISPPVRTITPEMINAKEAALQTAAHAASMITATTNGAAYNPTPAQLASVAPSGQSGINPPVRTITPEMIAAKDRAIQAAAVAQQQLSDSIVQAAIIDTQGGMTPIEEDAYRKALWESPHFWDYLITGGITLSALALYHFRKKLGFVHP
jgi:hypothetical protein